MTTEERLRHLESQNQRLWRVLLCIGVLAILPLLLAAGRILTVAGTIQAEKFELLEQEKPPLDLLGHIEKKLDEQAASTKEGLAELKKQFIQQHQELPRIVAGEVSYKDGKPFVVRSVPSDVVEDVSLGNADAVRIRLKNSAKFKKNPLIVANDSEVFIHVEPLSTFHILRPRPDPNVLEPTGVDTGGPSFQVHVESSDTFYFRAVNKDSKAAKRPFQFIAIGH
jgi:hypothetical protein